MILPELELGSMPEENSRNIVRVSTTYWSDSRGVYSKKAITYLKRKSGKFILFKEDVDSIGPEGVVLRVENLDSSEDGVYEVYPVGYIYDRETGMLEDYNYKLIPYFESED